MLAFHFNNKKHFFFFQQKIQSLRLKNPQLYKRKYTSPTNDPPTRYLKYKKLEPVSS